MASGNNKENEYPVQYQAQLRRLLVQRFNLEELKTLGFDLGIELDDLPGEGKLAKARELVAVMNRTDCLGDLAAQAERERPQETWPRPMPAGKENPYKGLSVFHEEDAHLFFGRETVVTRLAKVVHKQDLMAVIGPSGSGKSSVVFAGMVPKLREEGEWLIANLRPGTNPTSALATSLLPLLDSDLTAVDSLIESKKLSKALVEGELTLSDLTEQILKHHPDKRRLLLIADQFEELYTLTTDETERIRFLELLIGAQSSENERQKPFIVLTLRADFLGRALDYRPFADALQDSLQTLGPMSRDELKAVIVQPAEGQGVTFEEGLVDRILDDVGSGAGNLPLLEFCLSELWGWGGDGEIGHGAYESIGRVDGALVNHAEAVYEELAPEAQEKTRRTMLELIQPGQGTEDTRRLATQEELGSILWPYAQALAGHEARLVVVSRDETGQETAEIVHESVIQRWRRLRKWIDADRSFLTWRGQLRFSLQQWQEANQDEGSLLRGIPLEQARIWLADRGDDFDPSERDFIQASVDLQKREQRQKRVTRFIGWGALALFLLVILLVARSLWSSNCLKFGQAIGVHCQKVSLFSIDLFRANLVGVKPSYKDLIGANLAGANLAGADLAEVNLAEANLTGTLLIGASLAKTDLTEAELDEANLTRANLIRANLGRADLSEVDLTGANLGGADLTGANLTGANLSEADLTTADLSEADLISANLRGASLGKANLRGASLRNADLTFANLTSANLILANLTGADLVGADLTGAILRRADLVGADLTGADLTGAILRRAKLVGADLTEAGLTEADLTGAGLVGADLRGANLSGAILEGAILRRADLGGADLTGAILTGAILEGAMLDDQTIINDKWRLVWEIVSQGAENRDLREADLTEADLTEAILGGADLRGADLRGANLVRADLTEAILGGANLGGADLTEADLGGADLVGADLTGANLSGAILEGAILRRADLGGADLTGAILTGAILEGAMLDDQTIINDKWRLVWEIVSQGAENRDLREADLTEADLTEAILGGADLRGANLVRADLTEAILGGANLGGPT